MKLEGREFWKSWRLGTGTESKRAPRTQGNFKKQEDIHIYQLESKCLQTSAQQTPDRAEEEAARGKTGFSPTPLPQSISVATLCSAFLAKAQEGKQILCIGCGEPFFNLLTHPGNIHTFCWVLLLVQGPGSHNGDVATVSCSKLLNSSSRKVNADV